MLGWSIKCALWVATAAVALACLIAATFLLLPLAAVRALVAILGKVDDLLCECCSFFDDGIRAMTSLWDEWTKST